MTPNYWATAAFVCSVIRVLGWDVSWIKSCWKGENIICQKRCSLLLFASLSTSLLPATPVELFIGNFKGKKNYLSFQRDSSLSVILCKQITPNEVQSLSLQLHFEVIAAAKEIGLLRKQMPYFACSKKTMQEYKLYYN